MKKFEVEYLDDDMFSIYLAEWNKSRSGYGVAVYLTLEEMIRMRDAINQMLEILARAE